MLFVKSGLICPKAMSHNNPIYAVPIFNRKNLLIPQTIYWIAGGSFVGPVGNSEPGEK